MDVDGVLTDGAIAYDDAGHEQKRFSVADGLGLVVVQQIGIRTAWISGRLHKGVERRATELGITVNCQGVHDKRTAIAEICDRLKVSLNEVAYVGDDWNDIPVLEAVGCPIAVANAAMEVKSTARFVTQRRGGEGAVREVCEMILEARSMRSDALKHYLASLDSSAQSSDQRTM
jgi:3-deoxy-D-manno-octulosonate 8-phosphate phosphatase (KDO 8-P phosphatase)